MQLIACYTFQDKVIIISSKEVVMLHPIISMDYTYVDCVVCINYGLHVAISLNFLQ